MIFFDIVPHSAAESGKQRNSMFRSSRPRFAEINAKIEQKLETRGQAKLYQKRPGQETSQKRTEYRGFASEGTDVVQRPQSVVFLQRER